MKAQIKEKGCWSACVENVIIICFSLYQFFLPLLNSSKGWIKKIFYVKQALDLLLCIYIYFFSSSSSSSNCEEKERKKQDAIWSDLEEQASCWKCSGGEEKLHTIWFLIMKCTLIQRRGKLRKWAGGRGKEGVDGGKGEEGGRYKKKKKKQVSSASRHQKTSERARRRISSIWLSINLMCTCEIGQTRQTSLNESFLAGGTS